MLDELDYNKDILTEEFLSLHPKLTNEQLNIFNIIKDSVDNGSGGVFFVNGHRGTGKTFLWRVLTTALRSNGHGATRQFKVLASINASYIWSYCRVLFLTKNMRLIQDSPDSDSLSLREFSELILKIGDDKIGDEIYDGEFGVKIPDDLLISSGLDPIEAITNSTYPDFMNKLLGILGA